MSQFKLRFVIILSSDLVWSNIYELTINFKEPFLLRRIILLTVLLFWSDKFFKAGRHTDQFRGSFFIARRK